MSQLYKSSTGEIPFSITLAALQYTYGLTKDTLLGYLRILESLGRFEIDEEANVIKQIEVTS
jgi:hypothetical protein